jgi:hypothetical protein
MEIRYQVEVSQVLSGTVLVEGPLGDNPDNAERIVEQLLESMYPDAEYISVVAA